MSAPIHIGFDAKRLFYNRTGLGNYSRDLLRGLLSCYPSARYTLFASVNSKNAYTEEFEALISSGLQPKRPSWRSWGIHKDITASGIQLYHGLSNELPFSIKKSGIPSVVTIHDVIFKIYPEFYPLIDRTIYDMKTRFAINNADAVIAISERTKSDIVKYYGIDASKISVVYQDCAAVFKESRHTDPSFLREKYHLPPHYITSIGRIEKRKNLITIARALKVCDQDIHWVCIGSDGGEKNNLLKYIREHNLQHRVHFLEQVPVEDLTGILKASISLVYVSIYEGFGIPILEGIHSGTPVITSDSSCLLEVAGPESLYIKPYDDHVLADHIRALRHTPGKRADLLSYQQEFISKFSTQNFAKGTMDVYRRVLQ